MKATNLNIFLQLGAQIQQFVQQAKIGQEWDECFLYSHNAKEWLAAFIAETGEYAEALQDSRASAQKFLDTLNHVFSFSQAPGAWKRPMTQEEIVAFYAEKTNLERNFEREHRNIDVFTVTPKGIYNTRLLMEKTERKIPERLRAALPPKAIDDFRQAGRCLAFDVPTACAFHICRGTEALILAYYEKIAGHPWPENINRDWSQYIAHLKKEGAPESITARLDEIRRMDRNAYTHPERTVSLEEAPIVFELCTGVVFQMADKMVQSI